MAVSTVAISPEELRSRMARCDELEKEQLQLRQELSRATEASCGGSLWILMVDVYNLYYLYS